MSDKKPRYLYLQIELQHDKRPVCITVTGEGVLLCDEEPCDEARFCGELRRIARHWKEGVVAGEGVKNVRGGKCTTGEGVHRMGTARDRIEAVTQAILEVTHHDGPMAACIADVRGLSGAAVHGKLEAVPSHVYRAVHRFTRDVVISGVEELQERLEQAKKERDAETSEAGGSDEGEGNSARQG